MKLFLVLTSLAAFTLTTYAQRGDTRKDYVATDSVILYGTVILEKGWTHAHYYRHRKSTAVIYSPSDIDEFASDGYVYHSISLNGSKRFYQRLVNGKVVLYRGIENYLVKFDSRLLELTKHNFRSMLQENFKSPGADQELSKLNFNERALSDFISDVNAGTNHTESIDYRKVGVFAGYYSYLFNVTYGSTSKLQGRFSQPSIGVFAEFPISRVLYGGFEIHSFNTDILPIDKGNSTKEYVNLKVKGAYMLAVGKVEFASKRYRPYAKTGMLVSYTDMSAPSGLIKTIEINDVVTVSHKTIAPQRSISYGIHAGVGGQLNFHKRKNVHLEIKFVRSFKDDYKQFAIDYSALIFSAGISI